VDSVIWNSSSDIYEVPSFKKPTVNICLRQMGRIKSSSVIDVEVEENKIIAAIEKSLKMDCTKAVNPYEGEGSRRIIEVFESFYEDGFQLSKIFHNIN